jgi:hypothetical protein
MPRFRPLAALCAAAAVFALPATASADVGYSGCDDPGSSAVFAPWLDYANYFLAPDGGFENGAAGWALDGASVGAGNQSYGSGASSLTVDSGDSATSPSVCVGLEHPTFRYFVRRTSGVPSAKLAVRVVLDNGASIPVGTIMGGSTSWQPSPVTLIGANLLPLLTGGTSTQVAFRFTSNSGTWQVDDVYVDPSGSR